MFDPITFSTQLYWSTLIKDHEAGKQTKILINIENFALPFRAFYLNDINSNLLYNVIESFVIFCFVTPLEKVVDTSPVNPYKQLKKPK